MTLQGSMSMRRPLAYEEPMLGRDHERALARRWRGNGDRKAADRLVRAHLRSVRALAIKFRHYGIPVSELIAEGNSGLFHALSKFDPERGIRFDTYARHWVRAYMLTYVLRSWSIVTTTSGAMRTRMFFKARRERARATALMGSGEAMQLVLAQRLGVSLARTQEMTLQLDAVDVSLDAPIGNDNPSPLIEQLRASDNPEQALLDARFEGSCGTAIAAALCSLDPRERQIIEARVMSDADQKLSLAAIARKFGVSRERVRQLHDRALRKLKAALAASQDPIVLEWAGARARES
jgi:RNA polymerase sigma-32 factor